jgi:hypothetical protein
MQESGSQVQPHSSNDFCRCLLADWIEKCTILLIGKFTYLIN